MIIAIMGMILLLAMYAATRSHAEQLARNERIAHRSDAMRADTYRAKYSWYVETFGDGKAVHDA